MRCIRRPGAVCLGLIGAWLWSAPIVLAQQPRAERRWFVTASILGTRDRTVKDRSSSDYLERAWDPTVGIDVGVLVARRWSIRGELEIPTTGQTEYVTRPPSRPPFLIVYWGRQQLTRRNITGAALIGFHPRPQGRVRPSVVLGVTVARLLAEQSYFHFVWAGSPWQFDARETLRETHIGLVTGVDLDTHVTDAVAVVAQVRGAVVPSSSGIGGSAIGRLGVGARWLF